MSTNQRKKGGAVWISDAGLLKVQALANALGMTRRAVMDQAIETEATLALRNRRLRRRYEEELEKLEDPSR